MAIDVIKIDFFLQEVKTFTNEIKGESKKWKMMDVDQIRCFQVPFWIKTSDHFPEVYSVSSQEQESSPEVINFQKHFQLK